MNIFFKKLITLLVITGFASHLSANDKLTLIGSLESIESTTVVAEIDGVVEDYGYERGEKTLAKKPLVTVKQEDYQLLLERAKASLSLAKADLDAKQARFKRYQQLLTTNNLSRDQLDIAKSEYLMSKSTVVLNQLTVKDAELDLRRTTINTTPDLWVSERLINKGDWVQTGQLLYRLEKTDRLKAIVYVTETKINQVQVGNQAILKAQAIPSSTFPGKITRIGIRPDPEKNSYPVEILVENPQGILRPGFTVDAEITLTGK